MCLGRGLVRVGRLRRLIRDGRGLRDFAGGLYVAGRLGVSLGERSGFCGGLYNFTARRGRERLAGRSLEDGFGRRRRSRRLGRGLCLVAQLAEVEVEPLPRGDRTRGRHRLVRGVGRDGLDLARRLVGGSVEERGLTLRLVRLRNEVESLSGGDVCGLFGERLDGDLFDDADGILFMHLGGIYFDCRLSLDEGFDTRRRDRLRSLFSVDGLGDVSGFARRLGRRPGCD